MYPSTVLSKSLASAARQKRITSGAAYHIGVSWSMSIGARAYTAVPMSSWSRPKPPGSMLFTSYEEFTREPAGR
jgi:hypothetical protein